MSSLKLLKLTLNDAEKAVKTVYYPVNSAEGAVGDIKKILDEPASISKKLELIDRVMKGLKDLARFLSPFPTVGPIMKKVETIFKAADKSIKKMKDCCDSADAKLKPAKSVVTKIDKPLKTAKEKLNSLQADIHSSMGMLDIIERQYGDQVPPKLDKILETVNRVISPQIKTVQSMENKIGAELQAVSSAGSAATQAMSTVTATIKMIDGLSDYLTYLDKPLKYLKKVLEPFEKWLKWLHWIIDKFNDVIDKALRYLGINLEKIADELAKVINPLSAMFEPLKNALDAAMSSIVKIDPQLEKQMDDLASTAAAIEKALQDLDQKPVLTTLFAPRRQKKGKQLMKARRRQGIRPGML